AVVERGAMLGEHLVREGDAVIAMASSGVHSNGYSLVRAIVDGLDLAEHHGLTRPLGDALLEPTRIYALDCLALGSSLGSGLHALCHVTGGGLPGNLPRVLPEHLGVALDSTSYTWPEVFTWLEANGPVAREEMYKTFNCGVGMVAFVGAEHADEAIALLGERGLHAWNLGVVTAHDPGSEDARVTGLL
ncbi:MAG: phosphoribosylformylglycinamidine cyclo-ligase, partial [Glaciecola sp.]